MKLIRLFIAMGVVLLVSACASAPAPQPLPPTQQLSIDPTYAVATLAPLGSFEFEAAPTFTRNAMLRHRSAALARAGKIEVSALEAAIKNCDAARLKLDAALSADRAHNQIKAHQLLNEASAIISSAEVALNSGVK
jgi:hypothetical protein